MNEDFDKLEKEVFQGEYLFALYVGRSGSGKSAAAASNPKPLEEDDYDIRANGIKSCIRQGWLNGEGISFTQFDPFVGYIQVQKHYNLLYAMVKSRQFNLRSLDIGSLTSLIRLLDVSALTSNLGASGKTAENAHLNISGLTMSGPADYKFESQACHRIFDFLRTFPCHVTVAAHIIDKWGKAAGADQFAPSTVIGEKLTITANLGENVLAMFNDVYKFSKEVLNGKEKYMVEFSSEIAKNSFGLPPGKFDITKQEFFPFFCNLVKKLRSGEEIKPTGTSIQGGVLTF
jgi:hypothetical protein